MCAIGIGVSGKCGVPEDGTWSGLAVATDEISVRADIDDAGFVVVDQLLAAAPAARSRRFDAGAYVDHLGLAPDGISADRWTNTHMLRDLYVEQRLPTHEEALLTPLLDDLSRVRVH
ncbi:hypothetical protein [Streptomyces sp. S.PB5]|uniref:DUF2399 domain-containing protein n=1 Tax=Streptomyces sp. S.PB5 TaxID=3020844 RepID=UPI0025B1D95A|nr:hypothetical protein [Streptomyces sp. S.PB5]MDN3020602.1 hypothetical protein [Streptomyces sp. S.PB5]